MGRKHTEEEKAKISASRVGDKNPRWRGGRAIDADGYVLILCRSHPNANSLGRVPEHRLVMEGYLGRPLLPTEVVHHINGIPDDNRIENLALFSNSGYHLNHHLKERES